MGLSPESWTHSAALILPASSPFAFSIQPALCQGRSQKSRDVAHPASSLLALQLLGGVLAFQFQTQPSKLAPP